MGNDIMQISQILQIGRRIVRVGNKPKLKYHL